MEASKQFVCVWAPRSVWGKYKVRSTPTMITIKPDGEMIEKVKPRDSAGLSARLIELAASNGSEPTPKETPRLPAPERSRFDRPMKIKWAKDLAEARKKAERGPKAIVLLVTKEEPDVDPLPAQFAVRKLKATLDKFIFCRIQFDPESDLLHDLEVEKGPAVLVLDPTGESVLARHDGDLASEAVAAFLKPFTKARFKCKACGRKGFDRRDCCGAAMKP